LAREGFKGNAGQSLLLLNPQGIAATRLLVLGLGATTEGAISGDNYRKALQKISESLRNTTCQDLTLAFADISVSQQSTQWQARQLAEQLSQLDYRADKLKSKPSESSLRLKKVVYATSKAAIAEAEKGLALGQAIAKGVN